MNNRQDECRNHGDGVNKTNTAPENHSSLYPLDRILDSTDALKTGESIKSSSIATKLTDEDSVVPIAIAVPLGEPEEYNAEKGATSTTITASPKAQCDFAIAKESTPADFHRTIIALVCSGTILLGFAVIGTLVIKGIHHYQVLKPDED